MSKDVEGKKCLGITYTQLESYSGFCISDNAYEFMQWKQGK